MPTFLDDRNRLKGHRRNEAKNQSARWNEWRNAGRQHQRESIERPGRCVIAIEVLKFQSVAVPRYCWNTIEMRVDQPGMIVIASLSPGVNVLEWR